VALPPTEVVGAPLELLSLTPLPADNGPVPGELIVHQAHAEGHAAVLLADRGVLLAADMFSDVLIPIFDPRQEDQVAAFEAAFDLLADAMGQILRVSGGSGHGFVRKSDFRDGSAL
jgi:hypothetical protein